MPRKHTLGFWMALPDEADKPYIRIRGTYPGTRYKIANVLKTIYENPPEWEEEETRANASLIEAAPDLLAALETAVNLLAAFCGTNGEYPDEQEVISKCRAALSKATGT